MTKENNLGEQTHFEDDLRFDWRFTRKGKIPCRIYQGMFLSEALIMISSQEQTIAAYTPFYFIERIVDIQTDESGKEFLNGFVYVNVLNTVDVDKVLVRIPGEEIGSTNRLQIHKDQIQNILGKEMPNGHN